QTALHQGLSLAFADDLDRFCRRIVAVRRLLQRKARYVELRPLGDVANAIGRSDQDRGDQTEPRRLYGTLERDFVTWMGNRRGHRRQLLGCPQQPIVALVRSNRLVFHRGAHAALSRPTAGGEPANIASLRSSRWALSWERAPRAASTRRTNASASSHCRRLSGNSFGSAAIARSASNSRIRYCSLTISLNRAKPTRLAAGS